MQVDFRRRFAADNTIFRIWIWGRVPGWGLEGRSSGEDEDGGDAVGWGDFAKGQYILYSFKMKLL